MGERPVWNELTCDEGRCCSFSFWVDKEKRLMHLEDHTTKKTFNLASARSRPLLQFFSRSRGRAVSSLHSDAPPAGLPTLSRFSPMRGGSSLPRPTSTACPCPLRRPCSSSHRNGLHGADHCVHILLDEMPSKG